MDGIRDLSFEDVAGTLMPGTDCQFLNARWEESKAAYDNNSLFFLDREYIKRTAAYFYFTEEVTEELLITAAEIKNSPELSRLLWHIYYRFHEMEEPIGYQLDDAPLPKTALIGRPHMLKGFIAFTGLNKLIKKHNELGISEKVTRDTGHYVCHAMNTGHSRLGGEWGIIFLGWTNEYLSGSCFVLDRLVFFIKEVPYDIRVLRNRENGVIVTLAPPGLTFRSDGRINGADGVFDKTQSWNTVFNENESCYIGNMIMENGRPLNEKRHFLKSIWELALQKGDPMLDVHIPAGPSLSEKQCIDAYSYATSFFSKIFPDYKYKGFMCLSWLLDPELRLLLKPDSNIRKFQSRFRLYNENISDDDIFDNIFPGLTPNDYKTAPKDTSLKRAIINNMDVGWHFSGAWGYFLLSDFDKYMTGD